jgi:5-methylcytosine-specific restriction protein A
MKITTNQIAAAYAMARAVFNDELAAELGARRLRDEHGFNINTARDYIENYRHMREGEEFRRTISVPAADYFLYKIREDDRAALATAIDSLLKHVEYYESIRPTRLPGLRRVVEKNRADLFSPVALSDHIEAFNRLVEESLADSASAREARLRAAPKMPTKVKAITEVFARNADVVAAVLHRAAGVCERCAKPAPFFRRKDGAPYLEVHHVKLLSDGGEDTVANAIALCPNCHREKHHGIPAD